MKKLALIIYSSIFLFSCEEVVQIDVPSGTPKLVIEALFEVYFDQVPVTANTVVKLRLSADYFEEQTPIITNAHVTQRNLNDDTIISLVDQNLEGNYSPINSFIPEDNVSYELSIIYNNEIFKGITTKSKTPNFINVKQGDNTLFSGEETEVVVEFQDDESKENYYLIDFSKNLYLTIEDRFFNGSDYNFSFFFQEDEIELPEDIIVKMSGITKDYHTYFRVLSNQSGQSGGGPFQTTPSSLLGNIVNTTYSENFPLGYFHIAETATYFLSLTE